MQEKYSSLATREEKLWKDMPSTKLPEMLSRLTKNDLDEIRISLGVRGASSLKKQDLVAKLVEAIMTEAAVIFCRFDEERYGFVKQVALNGGCFRNPRISLNLAEYFRKHGLLFTGQSAGVKVIAVSDEVLSIFNQMNDRRLAERVKRNTQWIRLTHGLLYYYGVLSLEALIGMVAERSGKQIDTAEFAETIGNSVGCYDRIDFTDDGFCDARVEEPEKILSQQSDRSHVNYYPFSNDDIFQAGAPGFKEKTKYLLDLLQFIQASYDIAVEELDEIGSDCLHIINNTGNVNSVISYLNGRLEFPSMEFAKQVIDRAIPLFNATRQWSLKGFAPNELKQKSKNLEQVAPQRPFTAMQSAANVVALQTGQRIGRNDPCPCGSGQKFKRCCGK